LFIKAPSHVVGNKVEEERDGCKDELENKCANQSRLLKRYRNESLPCVFVKFSTK
jgi:hypothetical protein